MFSVEFMSWIEVQVELTLAFVAAIVCVIMSINVIVNLTKKPRFYLGWGLLSAVLSGKNTHSSGYLQLLRSFLSVCL